MRTVTYGGACSLDGYLTAADGAMDWLHFSRDVQDVMAAYWKTVDAVLMGRRTWEVALASGGELARSLFEADVIDEVGLNIHPVLLGGGTPAFHALPRRVRLELVENRSIDGGCVLVTYRVVHPDAAASP